MPDDTAGALRAARPTIRVGGQDQEALRGGLLELVIHETSSGLYRCEALFGNWGEKGGGTGYLYFDRGTLDFGKRFEVLLGPDALFDGRITGLHAEFPEAVPPSIRVLAEDRLQDLRMTRRTRTFAETSDADVMSRI